MIPYASSNPKSQSVWRALHFCSALFPLLPFALALALILAARSPPPILKGRGRGRSRGLVHRCKLLCCAVLCCALRCGAVLESLHNCQQTSRPPLLFSLLHGIISSVALFQSSHASLPPLSRSWAPPLRLSDTDPLPLCRRANSSAASVWPRVAWRVLACPGVSFCSPPHSRK
jgi:hypothetical protein